MQHVYPSEQTYQALGNKSREDSSDSDDDDDAMRKNLSQNATNYQFYELEASQRPFWHENQDLGEFSEANCPLMAQLVVNNERKHFGTVWWELCVPEKLTKQLPQQ